MCRNIRFSVSCAATILVNNAVIVSLGILLNGDSLIGFYANASASLTLDTSGLLLLIVKFQVTSFLDVLLLSHFIGNASSLKSHDQNWVPVCMPNFNSSAFLQVLSKIIACCNTFHQAYICSLKIKNMDLFLVLIAVETDSSAFKGLHESRLQLEKVAM